MMRILFAILIGLIAFPVTVAACAALVGLFTDPFASDDNPWAFFALPLALIAAVGAGYFSYSKIRRRAARV